MQIPNFFIAGAPKAGTTALHRYLSDHPQCFLPVLKEPGFFLDEDEGRSIPDLPTYLSLYREATAAHQAVGDASPLYLSSRAAMGRIRAFNPGARIVLLLRHPVDTFFSLYQQNLFRMREDACDPAQAWELQDARRHGEAIPRACRHPQMLQYREMLSLGSQVGRLYEIFPREQVLVVAFNDFASDTPATYERVLAFLGLRSDGRVRFPRENSAKMHRSMWLARLLALPASSRRPIYGQLLRRHQSGFRRQLILQAGQVLEALRVLNTRPWRMEIDPKLAAHVDAEMTDELRLLQELTGISLSSKYIPASPT